MNFKLRFRLLTRRLYHSRGLVFRALLCWGIGCLILINDEVNSYDQRFQLRGDQEISNEIVLVTLSPSDITGVYRFRPDHFGPLREITDITDSFYWDPPLWRELLTHILEQNPKKVGVTFFFNDKLANPAIYSKIFRDERIVWGTTTTTSDRMNLPLFANANRSNIGSIPLLRDEDGIIRRFVPNTSEESQHLAEKMAGKNVDTTRSRFLNYRGSLHRLPQYTLRQILDEQIPRNALTNKYVLIGPENTGPSQFLTPLGSSQRHEVHAVILDNILENRWILRASASIYAAGLFLLMVLSVLIISRFPQSVAFVLLLLTATMTTALSAWVFDAVNIWIPAASPAVQIAATWTIFLGYQANKIERENWNLQQEQKYLSELKRRPSKPPDGGRLDTGVRP
jgi:CHASE2 domain-containing sensor protein